MSAGPTLLKVIAYRWSGHYVGDPARYRDEAEVVASRERDPVARARADLDPAVARVVDAQVEQVLAEALVAALDASRAVPA